MLKRILSLFIILLAVTSTVNGTVVPSLYETQISVVSHSTKERNKALLRTLKIVLVKVSGNSKITMIPQIDAALKTPTHYVQEFNYISTPQKNNSSKLLLNVRFNKLLIDELLNQSQQVVWKQDRPLTLVWLIIKNSEGKKLIGTDTHSTTVKTLTNTAFQRGLPLLLPLLDISDLQQISMNNTSKITVDTLKQASKRYAPDETLIAYIDATNKNHIVGYWTLLRKTNRIVWKTNGKNLTDVLQLGINRTADVLAERFAQSNMTNSTINLIVDNLSSIDDYAKLTHYLHGLTGVIKVDVLHISKIQAHFRLTLNTNIQSLIHTIQLDSLLTPIRTSDISPTTLHYSFAE